VRVVALSCSGGVAVLCVLPVAVVWMTSRLLVRDRNSDTALHFAARHGNARLLSALIAASAADINMQVLRLIRSLSANSHTYYYLAFRHPLTLSFEA